MNVHRETFSLKIVYSVRNTWFQCFMFQIICGFLLKNEPILSHPKFKQTGLHFQFSSTKIKDGRYHNANKLKKRIKILFFFSDGRKEVSFCELHYHSHNFFFFGFFCVSSSVLFFFFFSLLSFISFFGHSLFSPSLTLAFWSGMFFKYGHVSK